MEDVLPPRSWIKTVAGEVSGILGQKTHLSEVPNPFHRDPQDSRMQTCSQPHCRDDAKGLKELSPGPVRRQAKQAEASKL